MTDLDRKRVRKARRGDRRALLELYDAHRKTLFGFLVRTLGHRQRAEDVFQEVWVKVLGNIAGFREEQGTFKAWLFRIASNAAVDRVRREARRRGPELDAPVGETGVRAIDLVPSDEPGPEREGAGRIEAAALERAMQALSGRQRAAIALRHQQGLSYAEVASTLGVAEGTAKTLVHRGVKILRQEMAEWLE
jgi:RNA polymerase sigma-70 factor (ECF subfamily)